MVEVAKNRVPGLFITGTDTGVGKTYIGAMIASELVKAGYKVGVYKPAASGCRQLADGRMVSDDAMTLWEAAGRPGDLEKVCPQCFLAPVAPHVAAKLEGRHLDISLLRSGLDYWRERSDILLVEGAGGLMSPLGENRLVADLAVDFGFPMVVVSRNVLGTINHTLLTLLAAQSVYKLEVAGIVFNNPCMPSDDVSLFSNREELARFSKTPILTEVRMGERHFDPAIDWFSLAR